jgi:S-methylmethionine-dependent homocysteine/selenocysteine methylase
MASSFAMSRYRDALPQLADEIFLTDSGIETDLLFNHGQDLPYFASFPLLAGPDGRAVLRDWFRSHLDIAAAAGAGVVFETATWRANPDWAELIGYDADALAAAQRTSVELLISLRPEAGTTVVVSGCVGPRGDGYQPAALMSEKEAQDYHSAQIETFAGTDADLVTAITMTYPAEAIGVVRAARAAGMPVVISFTVETDGRLPDGTALGDAITQVDQATDGAPAYFMINCAHPTHVVPAIAGGGDWLQRVRGLRANASRMSHAELDEAETLDEGDPHELGRQYRDLRADLPQLTVLGGCCGTDPRHIEQIAAACVTPGRSG